MLFIYAINAFSVETQHSLTIVTRCQNPYNIVTMWCEYWVIRTPPSSLYTLLVVGKCLSSSSIESGLYQIYRELISQLVYFM